MIRLLLAMLLFGPALPVQAALVTWEIRAVVRESQVDGPAGGDPGSLSEALGSLGAVVGGELSAAIRFDTSVVNTPYQPEVGIYRNAIDILDVTIGAWSLVSAGSYSLIAVGLIGPATSGESFYGSLVDATGTLADPAIRVDLVRAYTSTGVYTTALSAVPPQLSSLLPYFPLGSLPYDSGTVAILGGCGPLGCATFWAEIVEVSAVPEPAAVALVGAGLLALAALRCRRAW